MTETVPAATRVARPGGAPIAIGAMAVLFAIAPLVGLYPVFLMKALCFALFACAFNLLIGFGGLLSFGHAMFLGTAGYVCAQRQVGPRRPDPARAPRHYRRRHGCWRSAARISR
jgi:branched-chain amino acid transport system permease protein